MLHSIRFQLYNAEASKQPMLQGKQASYRSTTAWLVTVQQTSVTPVTVCRCSWTNCITLQPKAVKDAVERWALFSVIGRIRIRVWPKTACSVWGFPRFCAPGVTVIVPWNRQLGHRFTSMAIVFYHSLSLQHGNPGGRAVWCVRLRPLDRRLESRWGHGCSSFVLYRLQPHRPADHSLGALLPGICVNGEAG
jgi:hypothetical protein